jgi:hypothetical protein
LYASFDSTVQKAIKDEEANGGKIRNTIRLRGISPGFPPSKNRPGTFSNAREERQHK